MPKALIFRIAGLFFFLLLLFLTIPFLSQKSFSDFTMYLFRQELSGNTLSLHYTLADPAAFKSSFHGASNVFSSTLRTTFIIRPAEPLVTLSVEPVSS